MENIKNFIEKWGYIAFLGVIGIALLFDVGCAIYTSVVNPFVGIVALVGAVCALGTIAYAIYKEVRND